MAVLIFAGLFFAFYAWAQLRGPRSAATVTGAGPTPVFDPPAQSAPQFRETGKRRGGSRGQFCYLTLEVSAVEQTRGLYLQLFALDASGSVVDSDTARSEPVGPGQTTLVEFDLMNAGGCENIASWRVQRQ